MVPQFTDTHQRKFIRNVYSAMNATDRMLSNSSRAVLILAICTVFASIGCGAQSAQATPAPSNQGWTLVWSDDFSAASGSAADSNKWTAEVGGNGWGNNELEYYTARTQNVQQTDGNLVITAQKETYTGSDNVTRDYTSARLKTAGKFSQKYGRIEARMQLPEGQGLWPAFWMLGDDIGTVGWPTCGEIDIMELVGSSPSTVLGTLHGPGYSGANGLGAQYSLPGGKKFSADFHVFAIEWEPTTIRFYVDDVLYATKTSANIPSGSRWVFDHPFFIILDLAVGGNLPGNPDAGTVFPQTMKVDYVRVYSRN